MEQVPFDRETLRFDGTRFASVRRDDGAGVAVILPASLEQPRVIGRWADGAPWTPLRCVTRTLAPPERPFVGPEGGLWMGSGPGGAHHVDEWVGAED